MNDELKFNPHMPDDLVWKQYGTGIQTQWPATEWEERIMQVPPAYRAYIRDRLEREKTARAKREGEL